MERIDRRNTLFVVWMPAALCAAFSLMRLASPDAEVAYYIGLTFCFVIAAIAQVSLLSRVRTLENSTKRHAAHPPAPQPAQGQRRLANS